MRRPGFACLVLGTLGILATPVVVYWWVGDLTEAGLATENADFVVTPPGWSAATVRVAAIGCLGVVLVTAGVLIFAVWQRLLRGEWLGVMAQLAVAGSVVAIGYRVATAGVIGCQYRLRLVRVAGCAAVFGSRGFGGSDFVQAGDQRPVVRSRIAADLTRHDWPGL